MSPIVIILFPWRQLVSDTVWFIVFADKTAFAIERHRVQWGIRIISASNWSKKVEFETFEKLMFLLVRRGSFNPVYIG